MKALHRMDRYRKEVLQLSTRKHGINVQYLYDNNKKTVIESYSTILGIFGTPPP